MLLLLYSTCTHRETPRSRADCLDEKRDDDGSGFSALEVVIIEKQTQDRGLRELREGKGAHDIGHEQQIETDWIGLVLALRSFLRRKGGMIAEFLVVTSMNE